MSEDRKTAFDKAKKLVEDEKYDEAFEELQPFTEDKDNEYSLSEMETLSDVVTGKITGSSFGDDKKTACYAGIDVLEGVKLVKDADWVLRYTDAVYDAFSKMNRCARDEERNNVWCRLKEIYLEVILVIRKVWREKNHPDRLNIYLGLAKLCKSYLDVADEETFSICEKEAKEAKFGGKGTLDDDDWKDANKTIESIKKHIADAIHEKELIVDEDD